MNKEEFIAKVIERNREYFERFKDLPTETKKELLLDQYLDIYQRLCEAPTFELATEFIFAFERYKIYASETLAGKDASDALYLSSAERIRLMEEFLTLDEVDFNQSFPPWNMTVLQNITTGMTDLIPTAIARGCDPNVRSNNTFGNTPLVWAVANDSKQSAMALVDHCQSNGIPIDLNKSSTFLGNTPLILSVAKGHARQGEMSNFELTQFLLDHGADPNCPDAAGNTPLHFAAARRDLPTIELLLKHGADPHVVNEKGESPSDWAAFNYNKASNLVKIQIDGEFSLEFRQFLKIKPPEVQACLLSSPASSFRP